MEKKQTSGHDPSRLKVDGWANILTGLGIRGKDKRLNAEAQWNRMDESKAEQLYASDDIASKVVDYPVEDSLREGWKLIGVDDVQTSKLNSEFYDRLKLAGKVELAWKYARMYGGGGLLLMTDDTQDYATPLNPDRVKSIRSVVAFTRWELQAQDIESDLASTNYGLPKYYSISPRGGQNGGGVAAQKFHHSRVIRFEGKLLPPRLFAQNNYWHDSVLNQLENSLLNFNTSYDSAANAVQDFRVAIFKLKNLQSLVANNQDDLVTKRLQILNTGKSLANALVIDADGESMEYSNSSFAGIPETLDKMSKRLQAATPIPHTRLFGNSPSGMGGTGRAEEGNYYDYLSQLQENYLHPILMKLYRLIAAQTTVGIKLTTEFDVEFNPLWQMDDKELVEIRGKQAAADQIYLENGVLDPTEVRDSRFGTGKWSAEVKLQEPRPEPLPEPTPAPVPQPAPAPTPELPSPAPVKADAPDMIPPKAVQDVAAQGLEMRKKYGRGGTNIGVKRAADIAAGKPMSRTTLARMASYKRQLDECDPKKLDSDGGPTAEMIAAMLWGGHEGIEWAREKLEELDGRE